MLLGRTLTSQLPLSHRRRGFPSSGVLCDRCVGERKVRPMYSPRPAYFLSPEVPLILSLYHHSGAIPVSFDAIPMLFHLFHVIPLPFYHSSLIPVISMSFNHS